MGFLHPLYFLGIFLSLSLISTQIIGSPKGGSGTDLDLASMGYSASSLAVGESDAAQIQNPFAGYYNPAGLNSLDSWHTYSLQGNIGDGVSLYSVGIAAPLSPQWTINLNWVQIQASDIGLIATDNASLNTDLSATQLAIYSANGVTAALAYSLDDRLSFGLSSTFFSKSISNIDHAKGYGLALTPGVTLKMTDSLNMGVYAKIVLSYLKWQTGTEETLGKWINVGLAYTLNSCTFFSEVDNPLESGGSLTKLGGAFKWNEVVTLRGGYTSPPGWNIQTDNPLQIGRLTVGLGLNLGMIMIDYAYVGGNDSRYSDASRVSIGAQF